MGKLYSYCYFISIILYFLQRSHFFLSKRIVYAYSFSKDLPYNTEYKVNKTLLFFRVNVFYINADENRNRNAGDERSKQTVARPSIHHVCTMTESVVTATRVYVFT